MSIRHSALVVLAALSITACGGGGGGGGSSGLDLLPLWIPTDVKLADVDGDGRADVLALSYVITSGRGATQGWLNVWRQTAPGVFTGPQAYAVGYSPWQLAVHDMDGDGAADIVVTDVGGDRAGGSNGVWWLRQDASRRGTFGPAQRLAQTETQPYSVAVGDLDGDGAPDIVVDAPVTGRAGATLIAQDAAHRGSFRAPAMLDLPGIHTSIVALGDVDGDGRTDLVARVALSTTLLEGSYSVLGVLHGQAGGTLGPWVQLPSTVQGLNSQLLAITDANGDGRMDIVEHMTSCCGTAFARVVMLAQNADGSFTSSTSSLAGLRGTDGSAFADLDGNGLTDLALAGSFPTDAGPLVPSQINARLNIVRQDGTGAFWLTQTLALPFASKVAAGDVSGDGLADLVVFDYSSDHPALLVVSQDAAARGTFAVSQTLR